MGREKYKSEEVIRISQNKRENLRRRRREWRLLSNDPTPGRDDVLAQRTSPAKLLSGVEPAVALAAFFLPRNRPTIPRRRAKLWKRVRPADEPKSFPKRTGREE